MAPNFANIYEKKKYFKKFFCRVTKKTDGFSFPSDFSLFFMSKIVLHHTLAAEIVFAYIVHLLVLILL
ncbi:MAG: hypothetical protein IJY64_08300, partial [Bacteroidaceae bacterium]|nr:hypothetical protein [Bacteroidaceae bacterium]